MLKEFFPRNFFKNVTVNMVSCFVLEDEDDEEDAQEDLQKASSSNTDDRVLLVLEALLERMSWKEIFSCLKRWASKLRLPCAMQSHMLTK